MHTYINLHTLSLISITFISIYGLTGSQPEIFQYRGGFVEFEHFDKHFVKNTRKEGPTGKTFAFFFLDTLKTTF